MRLSRSVAIATALFLVAPLIVVVPLSFSPDASFAFPPRSLSFRYYAEFFVNDEWYAAFLNSLIVATATSLLTLALTVPAAVGFIRYRFRGAGVLNLALIAPLVTPHIMTALADYNILGRTGLLGTHVGLILAHTCLTTPLAFLTLCAALKGFDLNLERAAMSMSCGPLRTFCLITYPILRPGVLSSGLFAFVYSFEEPVVALFISGRDARTLPKKMFESIQLDADPTIAVVSTMLVTLAAASFLIPALVRSYRDFKGARKINEPALDGKVEVEA